MKRRTIKAVLRKVYNRFLENVRNPAVREILAERSFVTGGSITSMLLNEPVSDFDVYLTDREAAEAVARHYVGEYMQNPPPRHRGGDGTCSVPISVRVDPSVGVEAPRVKIVVKSAGIAGEDGEEEQYRYFEADQDPENTDAGEYVEAIAAAIKPSAGEAAAQDAEKKDAKPSFRPVFMSSNAITLSDKIQIVVRFYGDPEEIHKNYDYVHCTNYWLPGTNKLVLRPEALEATLNRELRYIGSRYPICSIIRMRKFLARGWTINAGQILKMAWQVHELNLKDAAVLEDQLVGVDAAYFEEVIRLLKDRIGEGKPIDHAYLAEIIDKVF